MNIKSKNLDYLLTEAGYKQHFSFMEGFVTETYIKQQGSSRFHFIFDRNTQGLLDRTSGTIHIDVTIKGRHKIRNNRKLIKKEIERIKLFEPVEEKKEKKTPEIKEEWLPGWQEITKRKVIKRAWYNPMRYFKGKFIYDIK
jgi:hypothetical protein